MFFRSFLHTNDEKDKVQLDDGLVHSLLNKKILDTMYKDDSDGIIGIFDKKKKKIVEELSLYPLYTLLVENSDIIQEFEKYSNQFKKYLTNKNNKKMNKILHIIPAVGKASRIGGIPKFLFIGEENFLIKFHVQNLLANIPTSKKLLQYLVRIMNLSKEWI